MSRPIECPTCGAGAIDVPADPRATVRCRYCGSSFERKSAEESLNALRREISEWLQKAAGVAGGSGASAIDSATRTFLFNDRILPGLRRDVRRVLDEEIGDVDGAPLLVPPLLQALPGFGAEEATLVTRREAVLSLRRLRARLDSDDVAAFATSPADRMALAALSADLDRTMLRSNAATALARGISSGAPIAKTNLEELAHASDGEGPLSVQDPLAAALARASKLRAEGLLHVLAALAATPPDAAALQSVAAKLDETSMWLLTSESRSLRTALASTGVQRDATAARVLGAIAVAMKGTPTSVLKALDALAPLGHLLAHVTSSKDASALVASWASALAARAHGVPLSAVADTSWVQQAVTSGKRSQESVARTDVLLAPFWLCTVRHTRAEGFFFVSGKQEDSIALVPASAGPEGTVVAPRSQPFAQFVTQAASIPSHVPMPLDVACFGPERARHGAKAALRARGMKNVTLGEPTLVYLPIVLVQYASGTAVRNATLGSFGPFPVDAALVASRVQALDSAVALVRGVA